MLVLFISIVFGCSWLMLVLGNVFTGHTILTLDPTAEIYELTPF